MACMAVANIVKSSLGPVGLDKMLVELDSAFYCVGGQSGRCNNYKWWCYHSPEIRGGTSCGKGFSSTCWPSRQGGGRWNDERGYFCCRAAKGIFSLTV